MNNIEVTQQARSLRPRDEAPFCWFSRRALELIEKSPEVTNQARAKLVYLAGHVGVASCQGKPTAHPLLTENHHSVTSKTQPRRLWRARS